MSTDGDYEQAKRLHQAGDLAGAEPLYEQVIKQCPDHADAHHMLGALLVLRHGTGRLHTALEHLKRAIILDPAEAKYRHTLGKAFEAAEDWQRALDSYAFACGKDPFNTAFQTAMIKPLTRLRRFGRVVEVCNHVLALEPNHPQANYKLASAYRQLRREADALLAYRRHLAVCPADEQAQFWVSVLAGEHVTAAPLAHVTSLFDYYADRFEEHLVQSLQYSTPRVLMEHVLRAAVSGAATREARERGKTDHWGRCVDLGCGTGLMGPLLRPHVDMLHGVDLSSKMVDKARGKGCYDDLFIGDIVEVLGGLAAEGHGAFELVVAADVMVYIGDLAPVFDAVTRVAASGAVFAFSTERSAEGPCERGYKATLTGRFVHEAAYVERVGVAAGWSLHTRAEATIRRNAGQPIVGDIFVFRRA